MFKEMQSTQSSECKLGPIKQERPKIVVVGAGIIGASVAWRLNRGGASVTLVDGKGPGGIASSCSFGWINATYGNPRPYFDLRVASMKEWGVLSRELDKLPFQKAGTLYVEFDRVDLPIFQKNHSQWNYNINWVGYEEIQVLEPNLIYTPEQCLLAPDEGTLQVEDAAKHFFNLFQKEGGQFVHQNINKITTQHGRVTGVEVLGGSIEADYVVVAAGVATQSLAMELGINIPMKSPVGLLVQTKPCAPLINRTILSNGLHIQQRPDGSLLAGADFGGGDLNENPEVGVRDLMDSIHSTFYGARGVELERYTLGYRPTPEDGMPVIGPVSEVPGVYIATMHSGATLAPIVSKFVADELLSGIEINMLDTFRPSRF